MLLTYFKFLLLGLFLLVSGCFQIFPCESGFSIRELPDATINQPYFAKIEIWGGVMNVKDDINWKITPEDTGLTITRLLIRKQGSMEAWIFLELQSIKEI